MHALYAPVARLMESVAADVVLPRYQNLAAHEVSEKAADDFVTIADRESEERLEAGLAALLPEAGVVGEEASAADLRILEGVGRGVNWIIDPIDGTGNFAAGRPPFGIMVALVEDGEILAGWIFDPLARRMCHAAKGKGAWIDGERIIARESGEVQPIAALAIKYMLPDVRADILARAQGRFQTVDIPNCAAEQYPRIALGQNDIAIFERALPWDHAPGALFLNEAGGRLSHRDGTPYLVGDGKTGLLGASSPRLWDSAAEILFS